MALILGIETSTEICSVALARNDRLIALRENTGRNDHAAVLALFIDEIIRENGYRPQELDAVAVSMGPGSYTGLRIGVSTAKGLCYSLDVPLIAVGSLESLARVLEEDRNAGIIAVERWDSALLCPMIDARRMEVYAQMFDSSIRPLTSPDAVIVGEDSFADFIGKADPMLIFGNGAQKCVDILPGQHVRLVEVVPSARGLVKPAYGAFQAGRFEDVAYFEPFYLKDFVLTQSRKKFF